MRYLSSAAAWIALAVAIAPLSAQSPSSDVEVRISVGVDRIESAVATFAGVQAVSADFLPIIAPSGKARVSVDDDTPYGLVQEVVDWFANHAVTRVALVDADDDAALRLRADGSMVATMDPERLINPPECLTPCPSEIFDTSVVVLDVAGEARMGWVEAVQRSLQRQGAPFIRVR